MKKIIKTSSFCTIRRPEINKVLLAFARSINLGMDELRSFILLNFMDETIENDLDLFRGDLSFTSGEMMQVQIYRTVDVRIAKLRSDSYSDQFEFKKTFCMQIYDHAIYHFFQAYPNVTVSMLGGCSTDLSDYYDSDMKDFYPKDSQLKEFDFIDLIRRNKGIIC